MNTPPQWDAPAFAKKEDAATESTRYLGETAFGTVDKVCAVCMVVNDKVVDPKIAEKIYNYIQDMFGPEALDYDHAFTPRTGKDIAATSHDAPPSAPAKPIDSLW